MLSHFSYDATRLRGYEIRNLNIESAKTITGNIVTALLRCECDVRVIYGCVVFLVLGVYAALYMVSWSNLLFPYLKFP